MKIYIAVAALLILSGCTELATQPIKPSVYEYSVLSKIISAEHFSSHNEQSWTMVAAGNNTFVNLPVNKKIHSYLYTLEINGEHIETQSSSEFNVGECVIFWHNTDIQENSDYNFVAGFLEKHEACPD